ncbi:MAG: hypothetical protein MI919_38390 [Holophagales bacterium]|nr:hypothetical protein [Holophagales bacterium]
MDWKGNLEALLEDRRERLGGSLSVEEVSRLHAAATGDAHLEPGERSHLLERLGADPEAARQLLALLRFGEGVRDPYAEGPAVLDRPGDGEEARAADPTANESWQRFRHHLVELGELPPDPAPASPAPPPEPEPIPVPARESAARRFLPLAASFLLGALLVLLGGPLWYSPVDPGKDPGAGSVSTPIDPPINLPIVELVDGGRGETRAPGVVRLPAAAGGIVLTLAPSGLHALDPGAEVALVIGPGEGAEAGVEPQRIHGLEPGPGGVFVLTLPRALLADGENRLVLELDGVELAVFLLELEMEDPATR